MLETLTSPQNPKLQLVRALLDQPKARRKHNAFVAEGARVIEDGLNSSVPVEFALISSDPTPRAAELAKDPKLAGKLWQVEAKLFDTLTDTESSQGLMAVFPQPELPLPDRSDFLLILDQLRDPGNLGAVLRSAEAAGAQAVLILPGNTDPWAPKVVRAGMGSHFRLPILTWAWEAVNAACKDLRVFHADMAGQHSLWQVDFTQACALLIGGEAEGISPRGRQLATDSVRIPMAGGTESLNAAVSASILMFEVSRQRQA